MNNAGNKNFMQHIQLHERAWGATTYPGRPNLVDIMSSPVVVFWKMLEPQSIKLDGDRYRVTLHTDLQEVEEAMSKLLLRSFLKPLDRKFIRAYVNGEEVRVRGVRVKFEKVIHEP